MMTAWKRNQVMTFKRNPHYWQKAPDGGALPYLDEIEFQIIPGRRHKAAQAESRRSGWHRVSCPTAR